MKNREILLIGDAGNMNRTGHDPVMEMIRQHLPGDDGLVAFLGDNVYPKGLPDVGHHLRSDAEAALNRYTEALDGYNGKKVFLSGNHDWNKGKKNGYAYVLRQQEYLEKLFQDTEIYQPKSGCPGPVLIPFDDKLAVIVINTQWWLQSGVRPAGTQFGCDVSGERDFFVRLNELIAENHRRRILVLAHSPIYSYSIHGGKYLAKHHLFPFTIYKKNAWVPLPVVGSLLPLYRKFIGAREDIAHPRYRFLRKRLKEIFKQHNDLIYVCGHEHNLQHIHKNGNHFIVSGSGSKSTYVRKKGKYLRYGCKKHGFFKLILKPDSSIDLETWIVDDGSPAGKKVYKNSI